MHRAVGGGEGRARLLGDGQRVELGAEHDRRARLRADILTVGRPDADSLATSVVAALRRCGLPNPAVRIRVVDRIPRNQASGKLKRFIAM